jgi:hypothetical protein
MLESATNGDREWLAIGIIVLILILRHLVIAYLSRSEKRR